MISCIKVLKKKKKETFLLVNSVCISEKNEKSRSIFFFFSEGISRKKDFISDKN